MAKKRKRLADELQAAAKAGTLGLSIRVPWTCEPIERATRRFEGLWAWLEECGAADWDRVDSIARHFHPDYCADQVTRLVDANKAPGGVVYLQMERGEFSPQWLAAVAPTIAQMVPKASRGKRGTPTAYLVAALHVSAHLAAHEYGNLCDAANEEPFDLQRVARHLYFFERFMALWVRTAAERPPTAALNTSKTAKARTWRDELLTFHGTRQGRNTARRVSASESAKQWVGAAKGRPTYEVAYRALLSMLKAQPTR
jgi:hypothetical protein